MATYSANPSVSGAVSATSTAASATLYTAPANAYAIINLYVGVAVASDIQIFIDSKTIHTGLSSRLYTVYVGPGHALTMTNANPGVSFAEVSGVQFTNGV